MTRQQYAHRTHAAARGFTIVEILLVTIVVGILAAIGFDMSYDMILRSQDSERRSDVSVIARQLERYYRTNPVATGATYPPTSIGTAGLAAIVDQTDVIRAPDRTTNSLVIASTNAAQTPTIHQYTYQPLTASGALCTTAPCARYALYYRTEVVDSGSVHKVVSMRQQ